MYKDMLALVMQSFDKTGGLLGFFESIWLYEKLLETYTY